MPCMEVVSAWVSMSERLTASSQWMSPFAVFSETTWLISSPSFPMCLLTTLGALVFCGYLGQFATNCVTSYSGDLLAYLFGSRGIPSKQECIQFHSLHLIEAWLLLGPCSLALLSFQRPPAFLNLELNFHTTDSAVKSTSNWPSFLPLRLTPMITPE